MNKTYNINLLDLEVENLYRYRFMRYRFLRVAVNFYKRYKLQINSYTKDFRLAPIDYNINRFNTKSYKSLPINKKFTRRIQIIYYDKKVISFNTRKSIKKRPTSFNIIKKERTVI